MADPSFSEVGREEPQVKLALDELKQLIGSINDDVSGLEDRLDPVLRPSALETNSPSKASEAKPIAPLAQEIQEACSRLRNSKRRLRRFHDHLEL